MIKTERGTKSRKSVTLQRFFIELNNYFKKWGCSQLAEYTINFDCTKF